MSKDFDCVQMKRKGAEHVRELTKGMSREQVLELWRKRTDEMRERQHASRPPMKRRTA